MQRLRAVLQDFTSFSTELSGLMAEGDRVSVRVRHRTRVRPHVFRSRAGDVNIAGEQALDWTAIAQFRLKDGKIAEEWVMRDELGMLVQMGKVSVGP
jgi:predicted ester cyclase